MLRIQASQMKALQKAAVLDFENRALRHLMRCFPTEFEELGPDRATSLIRSAIAVGAKHDIRSERHVVRLLDALVCLGKSFDGKALPSWARQILEQKGVSAGVRADQLWERAKLHTEEGVSQS